MPTKPPGTPDLDLTEDGSFGVFGDAVFTTGQTQPAGTGAVRCLRPASAQRQRTGLQHRRQRAIRREAIRTSTIIRSCSPTCRSSSATAPTGRSRASPIANSCSISTSRTAARISRSTSCRSGRKRPADLTNFTAGAGFAGAHTNYLAYDLDAGGDKWIALNRQHRARQRAERLPHPDPGQLLHQ